MMRDYFQSLTQKPEDFPILKSIAGNGMDKNILVKNLFSAHDILESIEKVNFSKGLGADHFNGELFKLSHEIRNSYCIWASEVMNGTADLPSYLSE